MSSFNDNDDNNDAFENDGNENYSTVMLNNEELNLNTAEADILKEDSCQYTVNDAIEYCGFGTYQILLFCMGVLYWMCDAIEIVLIGYLLPTLQTEWNLSGLQKAFIASVLFIGMLIGAIFFGWYADRYGRRKALMLNMIYSVVPAILSVFSMNWYFFMITRALTGLGVSGIQIIYGLISEFLPTKRRATILLGMTTTGTMIATILVVGLAWILLPYTSITIGTISISSWRVLLLILCLPILLAAIASPFMPESPRFDMVNGNKGKALATIERMARWNHLPMINGELVLEKTSETAEDITSNSNRKKRVMKLLLLFHSKYLRITCVMTIIWFMSSLTFFGIQLLSAEYLIGNGQHKYVRVFIPAITDIPIVIIHILIIDKIGRKNTMIATYGLGGILLLSMLIPFPDVILRIIIVLARIFIQTAFASANLATPEYFATEVRATGLGFTSSISRIAGIATPFISSAIYETSKAITLSIYATACFSVIIAVFFLPYDTANRSLSEIV
jgi:MFS family permease